jgi:hypothetical protein
MKPPTCRTCGVAAFGHICKGPAAGASLAAQGLTPAWASTPPRAAETRQESDAPPVKRGANPGVRQRTPRSKP